ncbi:MAG: T9SS type A sorting domain-containing protein [Fibrobacteres bacterium]|nr:T9SS type A sorting domain-containing protein [Fibrobacterota bacterium]
MKSLLLLTLLICSSSAQISFDTIPQNQQLYPRDSNDSAMVTISGSVGELNHDSLIVIMTRNFVQTNRAKVKLNYDGSSAAFRVVLGIKAETKEYGFLIYLDTVLVKKIDSVVAGDVFVIGGQSNAWTIGNYDAKPRYEFVRNPSLVSASLKKIDWDLSTWCGFWGSRLGYRISQNHNIPVCIINGAVSGAAQATLLRNESNPLDSTSAYGKVLLSANFAGVRHKIKAVYWYQGESNTTNPTESYASGFANLYKAWHEDFPALKKVYVWQINSWEGAYASELRDVQRRFAYKYPDIQVMAALGTERYNGHYDDTGYFALGEKLYRVVAQDFYGAQKNRHYSCPDIRRAFFSSAANDEITLQFSQPVKWPNPDSAGRLLENFIYLNDSAGNVLSATTDSTDCKVVLKLKKPSSASNITYLPGLYHTGYSYNGPILRGFAGTNTITFHKFPIDRPTAGDTGTVTGLTILHSDTVLPLLSVTNIKARAIYSSGFSDTGNGVTFTILGSTKSQVSPIGVLTILDTNVFRLIAKKGGYADTLGIHVSESTEQLVKLKFLYPNTGLLKNDSAAIKLYGYFKRTAIGDTMVVDLSNSVHYSNQSTKVIVKDGWYYSSTDTASTIITANYKGLSDSQMVKVYAQPSFVKRINFQAPTAPVKSITGWSIDGAGAYSASRGYGWVGGSAYYYTFPGLNYLESTVNKPGTFAMMNYKVNVPDGKYVIKICNRGWSGVNNVVYNGDTLISLPQNPQRAHVIRPITVTGGQGCILSVTGGICYLVLISDDGAPMELMAWEDTTRDPVTAPPTGGSTSIEKDKTVSSIMLFDNTPNPFNPTTNIHYQLPIGLNASYRIYSINGQLVRAFEKLRGTAAVNHFNWNGNNDRGSYVGSGIYIGILTTEKGTVRKNKLVLTR